MAYGSYDKSKSKDQSLKRGRSSATYRRVSPAGYDPMDSTANMFRRELGRRMSKQYDTDKKRYDLLSMGDEGLVNTQDLTQGGVSELFKKQDVLFDKTHKDEGFVNSLLAAYSTRGAELRSGRTQRKSSLGGGAQAGYSLLG